MVKLIGVSRSYDLGTLKRRDEDFAVIVYVFRRSKLLMNNRIMYALNETPYQPKQASKRFNGPCSSRSPQSRGKNEPWNRGGGLGLGPALRSCWSILRSLKKKGLVQGAIYSK